MIIKTRRTPAFFEWSFFCHFGKTKYWTCDENLANLFENRLSMWCGFCCAMLERNAETKSKTFDSLFIFRIKKLNLVKLRGEKRDCKFSTPDIEGSKVYKQQCAKAREGVTQSTTWVEQISWVRQKSEARPHGRFYWSPEPCLTAPPPSRGGGGLVEFLIPTPPLSVPQNCWEKTMFAADPAGEPTKAFLRAPCSGRSQPLPGHPQAFIFTLPPSSHVTALSTHPLPLGACS